MSDQELAPNGLQREVGRLERVCSEQIIQMRTYEAMLAASKARIAQLTQHRRTLFWLMCCLIVMLVIAVAADQ
jgi:hypothetical protein